MASLFAPKSTTPPPVNGAPNQNGQDRMSIVENALQQSGGDAKAAFYLAAQQMGIDGDQALSKIQSMGNINTVAQNVISSNPRAKRLFNLFSMFKK
jgi:hypothetical protein